MSLSVVGAPPEESLTTVSAVKERLGIDATDAARDGLIRGLIRAASDEVVAYCRRPFVRRRVVETGLSLTGGDLILSLAPVVEVHSVMMEGEPVLGFEIEDSDAGIVAGSGNSILGSGEALWWNDPFRRRTPGRRITAEYTGGFVPPSDETDAPIRTLPYDVEEAVIELVKARMPEPEQGADAGPRIKSKSIGPLSISYDYSGAASSSGGDSMPLTLASRLERWKRVV